MKSDTTLALICLLVGVSLIALALAQVWEPAMYAWVGFVFLFCGWRLVRNK